MTVDSPKLIHVVGMEAQALLDAEGETGTPLIYRIHNTLGEYYVEEEALTVWREGHKSKDAQVEA